MKRTSMWQTRSCMIEPTSPELHHLQNLSSKNERDYVRPLLWISAKTLKANNISQTCKSVSAPFLLLQGEYENNAGHIYHNLAMPKAAAHDCPHL